MTKLKYYFEVCVCSYSSDCTKNVKEDEVNRISTRRLTDKLQTLFVPLVFKSRTHTVQGQKAEGKMLTDIYISHLVSCQVPG